MIRRAALILAALAAAPAARAQDAPATLRLAAQQPIQALSYYLDPSPDTVIEANAVYDGLVSYNLATQEFEPLLAKSWQRVDATTLEFTLRDDVRFHDGSRLTAADAAATLTWLADPQSKLRFKDNWAWIASAEALGPNLLRVTAKQPTPYDLMRLAYLTAILPARLVAPGADPDALAHRPDGTGPYRALAVDDAKGIALARNEDYRHANAAKQGAAFAKITMAPVPDQGSRIAHLLAGDLDLIQQVSLEQAQGLAQDPRFAMSIVPGSSYMYVAFDAAGRSGAKPVTDERVRRALVMAIDRDALTRLQAGDAKLEQPQAMCWRAQLGCDYSLPLPSYDPAGAKKLLAEAGYGDGFDIEVTTFTGAPGEIAEAVIGQWHAIGVRAKLERLTLVSYRKKQQAGEIQIIVAAWPAGNIPDISGTIAAFFAEGPADYSGDPKLHALAAQSDAAMDPVTRRAIGRAMFDRATEKVYFVPIAPFPSVLAHRREIVVRPSERFTPAGYGIGDIGWK